MIVKTETEEYEFLGFKVENVSQTKNLGMEGGYEICEVTTEKYIILLKQNSNYYELELYTEFDLSSSRWTTATYCDYKIKRVDKLNDNDYELIDTSDNIVTVEVNFNFSVCCDSPYVKPDIPTHPVSTYLYYLTIESGEKTYFELSHYGGDCYYPVDISK